MLALQEYASSSDDENVKENSEEKVDNEDNHLKPIENPEYSIKKQLQICAAPLVVPTVR